jgi:hypothetical protein
MQILQTQCNPHPQCPVLNPFQPEHVCFCHIRKTNRAILQDRSNESLIQQYQTRWMRSPRNTKFPLWRFLCRTYFARQLHRNPALKNIPNYLKDRIRFLPEKCGTIKISVDIKLPAKLELDQITSFYLVAVESVSLNLI